jgi:cathepsin L
MMIAVCISLVGAAGAPPRASTLSVAYTFAHYQADFGKAYDPEEREWRGVLFSQRLQSILEHNKGVSTYKKGVNALTDLTDTEVAAMLGGRASVVATPKSVAVTPFASSAQADIPTAVDWRACSPFADHPECPLETRPASRITTAVKNQGHCGSCWAFGSTATLEGHFSLATGRSEDLAPQHLVSCSPNADDCGGTGGCSGSTADVAYTWLAANGGLASSFTYGYESGTTGDTGRCDKARTTPLAAVGGIGKPTSNDYSALMEAIATVGPVAVNVYASSWRDYESGVFDGCDYNSSIAINHVVALEGYGTDAATGRSYWLVRNSWGTTFGEVGYIRLLREASPTCGMDAQPGDGWDCKPYPKSVKVCGMCGVAYEPTYPTGVTAA